MCWICDEDCGGACAREAASKAAASSSSSSASPSKTDIAPKVTAKLGEIRPGVYIFKGKASCDYVPQILERWGWKENTNSASTEFDLRWFQHPGGFVDTIALPKNRLVNHFRGAQKILNHKSNLGMWLSSCPCCSELFFPRQYPISSASGFDTFLCDYVLSQAEACLKRGGQPSVEQVSRAVLDRGTEAKAGGTSRQPQVVRLFRCAHELEELLCGGRDAGGGTNDGEALPSPPDSKDPQVPPSRPSTAKRTFEESRKRQASLLASANVWVAKNPCIDGGKIPVCVLSSLPSIVTFCQRQTALAGAWEHVVQKYIERPLLVPGANGGPAAKADLRAWVVVLNWNPLVVFAHPQVYFRVATKPFKLQGRGLEDTFAHVTNHRETDNRSTLEDFLGMFDDPREATSKWHDHAWPQLLDAVRATLTAVRDGVVGKQVEIRRGQIAGAPSGPSAFELFGFDFALDEEWKPWLLEVNTPPDALGTCGVTEIRDWAEKSVEAMLRMALAYRAGDFPIPTFEELKRHSDPKAAQVKRTFQGENFAEGHRVGCYGAIVAQVPDCLVCGLDLDPDCAGWRLIMSGPKLDEEDIWQSYTAWSEVLTSPLQARPSSSQDGPALSHEGILDALLSLPRLDCCDEHLRGGGGSSDGAESDLAGAAGAALRRSKRAVRKASQSSSTTSLRTSLARPSGSAASRSLSGSSLVGTSPAPAQIASPTQSRECGLGLSVRAAPRRVQR